MSVSGDLQGSFTVARLRNLTDDPEVRYTEAGIARAVFRVAVPSRREQEPSFFTVIVWRDQAEHAAESLAKGSRVVVVGRLQQRAWTAEDGSARSTVEVVADELGRTCGGRRQRRPGRRRASSQADPGDATSRRGSSSMPGFRSVVSVRVRFVGRSFLYELKAGPAGGRLRRPSSAGRTHQRRSDTDLKAQVNLACRRPAPNAPILQGDLVQDDEQIGWRDPEAAQVPDNRPVELSLRVKRPPSKHRDLDQGEPVALAGWELEGLGGVLGQDLRPILVGDLQRLDRRSMNRVEQPGLSTTAEN
jgi:single stranded DNA-binding protein